LPFAISLQPSLSLALSLPLPAQVIQLHL
jgi:hypothetical protein